MVVIPGRNGRRVIHGALNAATGERVAVVRTRRRQDDGIAFSASFGRVRPDVPTRLIWENAPPHHPTRVLAAAEAAHITSAWLPFRSPELTPWEDLWRLLTAVVAANRVDDTRDRLAQQALTWLAPPHPDSLLACCGLRSSKFEWLPT